MNFSIPMRISGEGGWGDWVDLRQANDSTSRGFVLLSERIVCAEDLRWFLEGWGWGWGCV